MSRDGRAKVPNEPERGALLRQNLSLLERNHMLYPDMTGFCPHSSLNCDKRRFY